MSIGIAVIVPDGIALAADTQTTWFDTVTAAVEKGTGKQITLATPLVIPTGWSRMARKLFSLDLGGKTFAIITTGAALINNKTMFAVFQSAAHKYTGRASSSIGVIRRAGRYPETVRDRRKPKSAYHPSCAEAAEYLVGHVKSELASHFKCSVPSLVAQPFTTTEFLIAGYDDGDVAKPVVQRCKVFSGIVLDGAGKPITSGHLLARTNGPASTYTASWTGQTAYIDLVVNHTYQGLPKISQQFHYMTLADAIDYANFLVSFTCDFQRFAKMVPNCARPITSATLTPEGYEAQTTP